MDNSSERQVILAAHGSGDARHDREWRGRILLCTKNALPDCRIDLAYVKGEPALEGALRNSGERPVFILPLCLNDGKFHREIIPAQVRETDSGTASFLPPLFEEKQGLLEILHSQIERFTPLLRKEETDLILVSHGTAGTCEDDTLLSWLALLSPGFNAYRRACVKTKPQFKNVMTASRKNNLLVLPFFLSMGSHVMQDIPRMLGLPEGGPVFGSHHAGKRHIHYATPVGSQHQMLGNLISGIIRKNLPA